MTKNNYDYEAAKLLIDDETNVTETNPLKDLKNKFRWKIFCPL